jgi:ribosomal protein S18 acetylase RimI-like enzyme
LLKLDKWLSKQLGHFAYNLDLKDLTKVNFLNFKFKKILITIKTKKIINAKFLKKNKIKLIEKNITFFKKINKSNFNLDLKNVRFAKIADKKSVLILAQNAFTKSRFFQDKKINKKIAKKIKRNWVLNFFKKKRGDYLIISEKNKKLVGFLLIVKNKNNYIIDLIAVNKSYKNIGLASKMLSFFENYIKNNKKSLIEVSTQSNNKESIKFYLKNNFKIKFQKYIYHFKN